MSRHATEKSFISANMSFLGINLIVIRDYNDVYWFEAKSIIGIFVKHCNHVGLYLKETIAEIDGTQARNIQMTRSEKLFPNYFRVPTVWFVSFDGVKAIAGIAGGNRFTEFKQWFSDEFQVDCTNVSDLEQSEMIWPSFLSTASTIVSSGKKMLSQIIEESFTGLLDESALPATNYESSPRASVNTSFPPDVKQFEAMTKQSVAEQHFTNLSVATTTVSHCQQDWKVSNTNNLFNGETNVFTKSNKLFRMQKYEQMIDNDRATWYCRQKQLDAMYANHTQHKSFIDELCCFVSKHKYVIVFFVICYFILFTFYFV